MSNKGKTFVTWLGCALVGATFIGASLVKFDYIIPLEKDVMAFFKVPGDFPNILMQVLPRLLIAAELALGLALLQPFWRKRLVLPACMLLLLFFCGYLLSMDPSKENCGCFGAWLKMGPWASFLKSVGLLAVCGLCFWFSPADPRGKLAVPVALSVASGLLVYFMVPLRLEPPPKLEERFANLGEFQQAEGRSLVQGAVILCFFEATCEHCQTAARELVHLPPEEATVFMAIQGTEQEIEAFRAMNGVIHLPWKQVDIETFYTNIGQAPPRIYLLKRGQVVCYWDLEIKVADLLAVIRGEAPPPRHDTNAPSGAAADR